MIQCLNRTFINGLFLKPNAPTSLNDGGTKKGQLPQIADQQKNIYLKGVYHMTNKEQTTYWHKKLMRTPVSYQALAAYRFEQWQHFMELAYTEERRALDEQ